MKYAHLDENHMVIGWYDDKHHKNIPTPNVKVDEKTYSKAKDINCNCFYENGSFVYKDTRTEEDIEKERVLEINLKAGEVIESKYPLYKQLNITNLLSPYTEQNKKDMIVFIDNIRKIANDSIDNKTTLENINWGI